MLAPAAGRHRQGPAVDAGGATFRIWAPRASEVDLVIEAPRPQRIRMQPEPDGFFGADVAGLRPGALYRYRLDGQGPYPDPSSRYQPQGPHGPSMLVDPNGWRWRDDDWRGVSITGQVVYELHVGCFTREGTFDAAREKLPYLKALGVTLLEVMPVAEFPGRFNWGYDGVSLYAPYHGYGDYDAFKRFVDDAHRLGLGVILDVVYNHFGPDGAYHNCYSDHWYSDRYPNEWGDPLNFDGDGSGPVREFVIGNACYWIAEFHLDGLRIDATQSIHDAGEPHVLAELSQRARAAAAGRRIV
ncbi:MAG TPA: alpha-amylase family glycosyl hydrolase, partial [Burkholderiaceae bacterium]|nr:alpha-amylase family glycosyl hydrolase [Burkholderiaceae bacterium]